MEKIDSRFLDFSIIVQGIRDVPPENPKKGDQYIVGKNPTGAFAEKSNFVARYNGERWIFIDKNDVNELFDISLGDFIKYDSEQSGWFPFYIGNGNEGETLGSSLVRHVEAVIKAGDTNPSEVEPGEYFLNTATKKIHVGTDEKEWDNGTDLYAGNYLLRTSVGWQLMYYDGVNFNSFDYGFNKDYNLKYLFLANTGYYDEDTDTIKSTTHSFDSFLYYYDRGYLHLVYLPKSISTSCGKNFYTETHTLTADEVSNKAFTLTHSVESGEETNILCSVSGVIQPVGVAFDVSGDTFSWNNKTLQNVSLSAGDVFVVHYVKASA